MRVSRRVMSLGGGGAGGVVTMRQTDPVHYARQTRTGLRRGRDIGSLGPDGALSPHSLHEGDAEGWSAEVVPGRRGADDTTVRRNTSLFFG